MANLRLAMDAAFWDLNLASPLTLEGTVRAVPGEPAPTVTARASRTVRPQQLSFLSNAFPLGLVPSYSPPSEKGLGSFSLQSLLFAPASSDNTWWAGLVGQFRPRKLIANIKKEVASGDELELPAFKDVAKHVLDKSLYALGLFSHIALTDDTSLLFNVEKHGERKGYRSKGILFRKLPNHDVTLEAAWPELFLDRKGTYWEVPSSVSLDISPLVADSGLRYRFGLHKNGGHPKALDSSSGDVPHALMPGICAKAAFSYQTSRDFWREKEKKSTRARKIEKEPAWLSSYDIRLKEPHSAISGIIGGTCAAWVGGNKNVDDNLNIQSTKRYPFTADLFGSLCYTFQHGKFKNDFCDLTRVDARLDISSASAFVKGACHLARDIFKGHADREVNPLAFPTLNVFFQQQVAGPIVFRVDSTVSLASPSGKPIPRLDDILFGLSYSFRMLQSGKVLAWFSPKRKEGMVELRFFEF